MNPKDKLRVEMLNRLKQQQEKERISKSRAVKEKLFNSAEFKKAKVVMFYVSKDYEVNTYDMIDEAILMGKIVIVPKTTKKENKLSVYEISTRNELSLGNFGIYEPKRSCGLGKKETIDLVVTPGIVFDKYGNRIGHGRGCYDAFLKSLDKKTCVIGLAFNFQIVDEIPAGPNDIPVKKVISA